MNMLMSAAQQRQELIARVLAETADARLKERRQQQKRRN
jgi:hypothetical protein